MKLYRERGKGGARDDKMRDEFRKRSIGISRRAVEGMELIDRFCIIDRNRCVS